MRGIRLGLLLAVMGCGPAPGYEPEAPLSVAPGKSTSVVSAARAPRSPAPSAVEAPCDRARRWLERARVLKGEGWRERPRRLLAHAEKACPDAVDADTRRVLSPATASTSLSGARLVQRPDGRLIGGSKDGSLVVVSPEPANRRGGAATLVLLDGTHGRPAYVIAAGEYVAQADVHGDRMVALAGKGIDVYSIERGSVERRLSWTDEAYLWIGLIDQGRRVVAVGGKWPHGVVRVFDASSGDAVGSLEPTDSPVLKTAALVNDGMLVAAGDDKIYAIDLKTMQVARELDVPPVDGRAADVAALATTPDRVAAATRDNRLLMWDPSAEKPIAELVAGGTVSSLALSRDGKRLMAALTPFGDELKTYDVGSKTAVRSRPLPSRDVQFMRSGDKLFVSGYGGTSLEDLDGKALWPAAARISTPEGVALSHGLALAEERDRDGGRSVIELRAWYRGELRRFAQPGYREDVLAISPSGRHVAAVVARDGWLWDLSTGGEVPFATPDARGFPDTLAFADATTLRLVFERPLASFVAGAPFKSWRPDVVPGPLDGFYGTAVSVHGDVISDDERVLTLAKTNKKLMVRAGGFAYSGDGERIFIGAEKRLVWFDRSGKPQGEHALDCTPDEMGVDRQGRLVAVECGHRALAVFQPPNQLRKFPAEMSIESIHVSPAGHLIVVRGHDRVRFIRAADLTEVASMAFHAGEPLLQAPDGRIMFWDDAPGWSDSSSCLVGHRARPASECFDALMDDALLDVILAPP